MDIPIYDHYEPPRPKNEVKIEQIETVVYPDRFRVFVHILLTPFEERPNMLLTARTAEGKIAAELSIIETMHNDMEFTLHLRGLSEPAGTFTLTAELYYETRNPPQDRSVVEFVVPNSAPEP